MQGVSGALEVLMKDAIRPTIMQTLEVWQSLSVLFLLVCALLDVWLHGYFHCNYTSYLLFILFNIKSYTEYKHTKKDKRHETNQIMKYIEKN